MVEVVQDLLDHVTYAGGVGRRRVDAVRGLGAGTPALGRPDCALVAEEPDVPDGPRIARMKDLMFYETMDKPFEEKSYRLQLEEFAYRGERLIKQVDEKVGEVQRMIRHDVLARSRQLPCLLRAVNDEMKNAQGLICTELENYWHMRFEPFFYPSEGGGEERAAPEAAGTESMGMSSLGSFPSSPASAGGRERADKPPSMPGGWLDLDDMFLTVRLLTRFVADLVDLVGSAARELPQPAWDVLRAKKGPLDPRLRAVIKQFIARVPWLGASLRSDETPEQSRKEAALVNDLAGAGLSRQTTAGGSSARASVIVAPPIPENASRPRSAELSCTDFAPLNQAITALDKVLTVHMKQLVSDLHRTMYQTFVRISAAYARWKYYSLKVTRTAKDRLSVGFANRRSKAPSISQGGRMSVRRSKSGSMLSRTTLGGKRHSRMSVSADTGRRLTGTRSTGLEHFGADGRRPTGGFSAHPRSSSGAFAGPQTGNASASTSRGSQSSGSPMSPVRERHDKGPKLGEMD